VDHRGDLGHRHAHGDGWHDLTAKRTLDLPGSSEHFKEDYKAAINQVFGELGHVIQMGNAQLEPGDVFCYVEHARE
jgi:uncharacterized protein with beta-barrel porin domain